MKKSEIKVGMVVAIATGTSEYELEPRNLKRAVVTDVDVPATKTVYHAGCFRGELKRYKGTMVKLDDRRREGHYGEWLEAGDEALLENRLIVSTWDEAAARQATVRFQENRKAQAKELALSKIERLQTIIGDDSFGAVQADIAYDFGGERVRGVKLNMDTVGKLLALLEA